MIEVKYYTTQNDERVINKTIENEKSFDCVLKDNTSITKPIIQIATSENLNTYNYCYIPDFHRYYFIDDIMILKNGLYQITARCDVLMTYKPDILDSTALINRQENIGQDFLVDEMKPVYNYKQTTIQKFPYPIGDKNDLQFVLTVGGSN